MNLLIKILEREEGWRDKPYYCSEGYPTIGYGFKIGPKGAMLELYQFSISREVGAVWLRGICAELEDRMAFELAPVKNAGRRAVLLSMAYQMGIDGVRKFRKMWEAIERQDWGDAADQMLDSLWARQTTERASRHACIMRGENPAEIYL
jgi:lysozyme